MKGKVRTILGDVDPSTLGRVLPHEHLEVASDTVLLAKPLYKPELKDCEFKLKNLFWIRQFPYSHVTNLKVTGADIREILFEEMRQFKSYGGGTIVDNTNFSMRPSSNFDLARKIALEAEIKVIFGTGFYISSCHDSVTHTLSEESLASKMANDIQEGCERKRDIKCGMIGELGCSWPLQDFEIRTLKAAATLESTLGCPVMVHPGRSPCAPEEILRIFSEAGGDPRRLVMGHLDRTLTTIEDNLEFARFGSFLEYDLFGNENSYYQLNEEISMPSDDRRIEVIQTLLQEGFEDRILVSHDIHTRHRLEHFGGHGYSHILRTIVPRMLKKGISSETVDKITIHNPANWLTFVK